MRIRVTFRNYKSNFLNTFLSPETIPFHFSATKIDKFFLTQKFFDNFLKKNFFAGSRGVHPLYSMP